MNPRSPPARSTSLPPRLRPPSTAIHDELSMLHPMLSHVAALTALTRLYHEIEELLRSPSNRQTLARLRGEQSIEDALDGYILLLDACNVAREVLDATKERAQGIQSALRRRRTDATVAPSIDSYMNCRVNVKKSIHKCLTSLDPARGLNCRCTPVAQDLPDVLMLLKDVRDVSFTVLRLLMRSLAPVRSLSPMACLIPRRKVEKRNGTSDGINKLEVVDATILVLLRQLKSKKAMSATVARAAQRQLEGLELEIEKLEAGVEAVFRSLIQNRVSLLNILSL